MVSELELIYDDFDAELVAVEQMIASLRTTGTTNTAGRARVAGANAAILLLAAMFEEFVRQTVKASFIAKAGHAVGMQDFPAKLTATVWRRSLERLARTPFDDVEANSHEYDNRIQATLRFCLSKDLQSDVAEALAHNESNMRPGELNRLFKQIGLPDICGKAATNNELILLLGCDSAGTAKVELETRMEDFFRRRNEIAHAITLNSSTGPTSLSTDVSLFRALARALCRQCENYITPLPLAPPAPTTAPGTAP